jgi:hypothetical protein
MGSHATRTVVYIVDPDAQERQWIEGVLSPSVDSVRSLDNAEALLALLGAREGACAGGAT